MPKKYPGGVTMVVLTASALMTACVSMPTKSTSVGGQDYQMFDSSSRLHTQYTRGFIGDYDGLIEGDAYGVNALEFAWLRPDVTFGNYSTLYVTQIENWTNHEVLHMGDSEYDISRTATGAFLDEPRLAEHFRTVRRVGDSEPDEGLILKGVVTDVNMGVVTAIHEELLLIDAATGETLAKMVISGTNIHPALAAEGVATELGDLIGNYLTEPAGFDPSASPSASVTE